MRLAAGPRVSEATQQETLLLVLRNVAASGCDIQGYPGVALLDGHGSSLGFAYRRRGDQMLTSSAPAVVALAPGATAYLGVNKNACVTRASDVARQVDITLPGSRQSLALTLPASRVLDYCGSADPGHTVDIAPVEPSLAAVYAQH